MTTTTEARQQAAARFAEQLGLDDGDALYRGAMAAWSSLNPQVFTFDGALSVAGVVLAAARQATWRKCGHCHADITKRGSQWAGMLNDEVALICPWNAGGHEPAGGDGRRSYILAADPVLHGGILVREVIETAPDGRRTVFAVVSDNRPVAAADALRAIHRAYDAGRDDLAAEVAARDRPAARYDAGLTRAIRQAQVLYARDEREGCEDYARGQAALIAATFGLDDRRDEIEDAITGRDTEAEDAAGVAEAVAALAKPGDPVPAEQVWDELGLGSDEAARRSQAEVLGQARATRDHMRRWADGEDTHHGEGGEG